MTDNELDDLTEWVEERAAILEFEANMMREDAERMARELAREVFGEQ